MKVLCIIFLCSLASLLGHSTQSHSFVSRVRDANQKLSRPHLWLKIKGGASPKANVKKNTKNAIKKKNEQENNKLKKKSVEDSPKLAKTPIADVETDEDDDEDEDLEQSSDSTVSAKPNMLVDILFNKTPPITRAYILVSTFLGIFNFLFNKNQWPEILTFSWKKVFLNMQFWRIATTFLYLGPLDLFFPLTLQFVWQHMSMLEKNNFQQPSAYVTMCLFGMASLLVCYGLIQTQMPAFTYKLLGHNFACFLVYVWSRVYEGMDVNFMELFNIKAELLPWLFCLQTYLLEQEFPITDIIGILIGHLYMYLKKKNLLSPPAALVDLMGSPYFKREYEKFRGDFE